MFESSIEHDMLKLFHLIRVGCNKTWSQGFYPFNVLSLFVTSQLHLKIAALPVFCWALDHVARFLRRNFSRLSFYRGYLEEPCLWVETNNTSLSLLSSNAELALGFLLIISLFSWWRNFMQTFIYWNVSYLLHI
ncbi:hypothetical protein ZWY2020_045761 [Hordeum vulgare]|nr:hypothetical protein ZWY2020_045761 [Hordeum vulgare]